MTILAPNAGSSTLKYALFSSEASQELSRGIREGFADPHVALAGRLHIRRSGFHGISHQYVAGKATRLLQRAPEPLRLISLHLGNGASAAAIDRGRCVDISMGMTPLEGFAMGTCTGDMDPSIPGVLHDAGFSPEDVTALRAELLTELACLGGAVDAAANARHAAQIQSSDRKWAALAIPTRHEFATARATATLLQGAG
jgi:acetate kinase